MKQKKIFMIMILVISIALIPGENYAALQANSKTHGKGKNMPETWITSIRSMEEKNQAMGLEEIIDNSTLKAKSNSNDIDVHMIKSTEYGAVAILSASGYGNPEWIHQSEIKTTTGNKTGVYFNGDYEYVAGGIENKVFLGIDMKYYDAYTTNESSAKVGDALGELGCKKWHNANAAIWITSEGSFFNRGYGSIFRYSWSSYTNNSPARQTHAVAVCGEGF